MLLESIKLVNFRQFKDEYIEFAKGQDGKNVTIIIGENGTGKTTFAQAFFWCMYGETSFSDKVMLNKQVAAEMKPIVGQTDPDTPAACLRLPEYFSSALRMRSSSASLSERLSGSDGICSSGTWCIHSGSSCDMPG